MTMPLHLLFGVHAHQPVGNFPAVIDDAHARCYGEFLRVLDRYPDFRFSVHFSGWLLDVLCAKFPGDMALLTRMTARGQVEWFGSGDCEPVLAAIPQRDRLTQLKTLSTKIAGRFGQRPLGAWLTERVWESSVVPSLVDAGIRYVAVDDYHFLCTGVSPNALDGFYTTEEDGRTLDLFPISEDLRYRLPFSPADEAVAHLENLARQGHQAAIYFDDIEKFGIWPETHEWVYGKGWLARFIEGVLASPLIRTATYAEYHAGATTRGIVYLPTASYIEMNEWTLPPHAAHDYANLIDAEKAAGRYARHKPFLRGGIWRNFLSRYPESNWMHKRMLDLSRRLAELPASAREPSMQEWLHRAQANDAYWHGLFGGLYLPHLRRAVWHNLIALEAALDARAPRAPFERRDIDRDGRDELVLVSPELQAICRDDGDACIVELDSYPLAHNFVDTLRRHVEGYHAKIDFAAAASGGEHHDTVAASPVSAHDRVAFLHAIAPEDIAPDLRPRGVFVDTRIDPAGNVHPLDAYRSVAASPAGEIAFSAPCGDGYIEKRYRVGENRLTARYAVRNAGMDRIEIRLNLSMPSCDGYSGRYRLEDGRIPCGFGQELTLARASHIALEDAELGGSLAVHFSRPLHVRAGPYYTVSQSEAGFEKIMQGVCLDLAFGDGAAGDLTITLVAIPSSEEKTS